MPLRAYMDNEEILSIDQNDEQWKELRTRLRRKEFKLTMPCCNQEGFLRTSHKGLKHFVHSKSSNLCDWKPESSQHLRAKIEIIEACKENGWKAIPEFSECNWRADVLAVRNKKRIAFEVQWSRQTYEETKRRQEKYNQSNVRGCWFFRMPPIDLRNIDDSLMAQKELPAFQIREDENLDIVAQLHRSEFPLRALVDKLLKGKLKFCEEIRLNPKQELTIVFFKTSCWRCKKEQFCFTVESNLHTVCNQDYHLLASGWNSANIDKNPQVYSAVKEIITSNKERNIRVGTVKKRYSKTQYGKYLSHGCFYCDVIFDDYFLHDEKFEGLSNPQSLRFKKIVNLESKTSKHNHWCFSENGEFCQ